MKRISIGGLALIIISVLAFASCGGKKETTTTEKTSVNKEEKAEEGGLITLTKEQMEAVGIELGGIERKNLTAVIRASGQLAVPPQNRADVNVLFGGIVQHIYVMEGQNVRKGQTLALLENADFIKLQQDYLAAKGGFSYVQQEYQRQQALKAADAGTGKMYQQAAANFNAERARLAGMEKQLQQVGISPASVARGNITRLIPVVAPISGTVGSIHINTGSYAEPAKPLMDIVDNSKIHADLTVYEKDLFKVRNGQSVRFILTNLGNQEIYGEIYGVNKSFEGETKGIIVHAAIKANKYHLIPGMYVTALIDIGQQETPAVPVDAIVRAEGKDYIFVASSEEAETVSFRKEEVATGVSELGFTQITPLEELPSGAKIITKGAFYVLAKSQGSEEEEK
ncbi:MAG: efflux RND transporter periplasmic adaptor subunit [Bacteroidetes bacterium]|nr:efflux RND transporter periplasmic adaptor subunit [Bacteroidota bacterium]